MLRKTAPNIWASCLQAETALSPQAEIVVYQFQVQFALRFFTFIINPSEGMTSTTKGVTNDPKIADTKSRKSARLIKKTTVDSSKKSSTSKDSKMTKFSKALPSLDITKLELLSNPNRG